MKPTPLPAFFCPPSPPRVRMPGSVQRGGRALLHLGSASQERVVLNSFGQFSWTTSQGVAQLSLGFCRPSGLGSVVCGSLSDHREDISVLKIHSRKAKCQLPRPSSPSSVPVPHKSGLRSSITHCLRLLSFPHETLRRVDSVHQRAFCHLLRQSHLRGPCWMKELILLWKPAVAQLSQVLSSLTAGREPRAARGLVLAGVWCLLQLLSS